MAAYTTIDDPSAYFRVKIYTGTGSALALTFDDTDTDMQPDFIWCKSRDDTSSSLLFDSVRGTGKYLNVSSSGGETTEAQSITAFGSDGFSLGTESDVNTSTNPYVAWCFKGGTTSGITTTNSTITPAGYSFNATSGFSVVRYVGNDTSGAKVPHGLGAIPDFVAIKYLDGGEAWICGHDALSGTWTHYIRFDTDGAEHASAVTARQWNNTAPTQYNVVLGDDGSVNDADTGRGYSMYCWKAVQGFSKYGTFEGNGNADGIFVYTGFRPAFVMTKSIDSTSGWHMFDNKREGYNVDNDPLLADATSVEATTDMIDILSNGFKLRISGDPNVAETYIYMAVAESPFVNSNGVPTNAR